MQKNIRLIKYKKFGDGLILFEQINAPDVKPIIDFSGDTTPVSYTHLDVYKRQLYSTTPLSSIFLPGSSGTKNALDKHHIFPKNYLANLGIKNDRDRNQTANFTFLDYNTNINIADKPPNEYFEDYRAKLGLSLIHI